MTVTAYFFGGPKDGEILETEDASSVLVFPVFKSPRFAEFASGPTVEVLTYGDLRYRRRGPVLFGRAYYDYEPGGESE